MPEDLTPAEQAAYEHIYEGSHNTEHSMLRLKDGPVCERCTKAARAVVAAVRPIIAEEVAASRAEHRRTFLVSYSYKRNAYDSGFGSIDISFTGPLNMSNLKGIQQCICEKNTIPLDSLVILSMHEMEEDEHNTLHAADRQDEGSGQ